MTLADGSYKNIMDIKPGDVVKAIDSGGNLIDSEVVHILHKSSNASAMFQIIHDSNGNSISLTGTHLINVVGKGYVKAASISIGDRLRIYSDQDREFKEFKVAKIDFDFKSGFTAPLTQSGTILVNNIDSSCYAEVSSHFLADLSMTPVKIWYRLSKLWTTYFQENNYHRYSAHNIDSDVEVSSYSTALYKLASLFFSSYLL